MYVYYDMIMDTLGNTYYCGGLKCVKELPMIFVITIHHNIKWSSNYFNLLYFVWGQPYVVLTNNIMQSLNITQ